MYNFECLRTLSLQESISSTLIFNIQSVLIGVPLSEVLWKKGHQFYSSAVRAAAKEFLHSIYSSHYLFRNFSEGDSSKMKQLEEFHGAHKIRWISQHGERHAICVSVKIPSGQGNPILISISRCCCKFITKTNNTMPEDQYLFYGWLWNISRWFFMVDFLENLRKKIGPLLAFMVKSSSNLGSKSPTKKSYHFMHELFPKDIVLKIWSITLNYLQYLLDDWFYQI